MLLNKHKGMRSSGGNGAALVLTAFFAAPRLAAVLGTVSLTPLPETARIEMRVTAMTIPAPNIREPRVFHPTTKGKRTVIWP